LPYVRMKEKVLGKSYDLSFAIIGNEESRKLNLKWRKKDKPTDILSFPLGKNEGEIFINLAYAKKRAPLYHKTFLKFIGFLFIHGLLHLKGYEHGSTMSEQEEKVCRAFGL